jgi:hypothetical protein
MQHTCTRVRGGDSKGDRSTQNAVWSSAATAFCPMPFAWSNCWLLLLPDVLLLLLLLLLLPDVLPLPPPPLLLLLLPRSTPCACVPTCPCMDSTKPPAAAASWICCCCSCYCSCSPSPPLLPLHTLATAAVPGPPVPAVSLCPVAAVPAVSRCPRAPVPVRMASFMPVLAWLSLTLSGYAFMSTKSRGSQGDSVSSKERQVPGVCVWVSGKGGGKWGAVGVRGTYSRASVAAPTILLELCRKLCRKDPGLLPPWLCSHQSWIRDPDQPYRAKLVPRWMSAKAVDAYTAADKVLFNKVHTSLRALLPPPPHPEPPSNPSPRSHPHPHPNTHTHKHHTHQGR